MLDGIIGHLEMISGLARRSSDESKRRRLNDHLQQDCWKLDGDGLTVTTIMHHDDSITSVVPSQLLQIVA